jgi:hypothetical protein
MRNLAVFRSTDPRLATIDNPSDCGKSRLEAFLGSKYNVEMKPPQPPGTRSDLSNEDELVMVMNEKTACTIEKHLSDQEINSFVGNVSIDESMLRNGPLIDSAGTGIEPFPSQCCAMIERKHGVLADFTNCDEMYPHIIDKLVVIYALFCQRLLMLCGSPDFSEVSAEPTARLFTECCTCGPRVLYTLTTKNHIMEERAKHTRRISHFYLWYVFVSFIWSVLRFVDRLVIFIISFIPFLGTAMVNHRDKILYSKQQAVGPSVLDIDLSAVDKFALRNHFDSVVESKSVIGLSITIMITHWFILSNMMRGGLPLMDFLYLVFVCSTYRSILKNVVINPKSKNGRLWVFRGNGFIFTWSSIFVLITVAPYIHGMQMVYYLILRNRDKFRNVAKNSDKTRTTDDSVSSNTDIPQNTLQTNKK